MPFSFGTLGMLEKAFNTPEGPQQFSVGDAIGAWVENYPKVMELMQKYAPQEAQVQLEVARQFSEPLGRVQLEAMKSLYPETTALQENLAEQARLGMEGSMPDWLEDKAKDYYGAFLGTNVGSPVGADYASTGMLAQQQAWQDKYRDLALSLTGRQPIAQPGVAQYSQQTSAFNPQTAMGFIQGQNQLNQQAYQSQLGYKQGVMNMVGQIVGSAAGAAGAAAASSKKLKYDIEKIDGALDIVDKIEAVTYKWNENKMEDGGVIAEQLEEVMPDSTIDIDGIKHVKPMMIIGYLIGAIKELNKKLEVANG